MGIRGFQLALMAFVVATLYWQLVRARALLLSFFLPALQLGPRGP